MDNTNNPVACRPIDDDLIRSGYPAADVEQLLKLCSSLIEVHQVMRCGVDGARLYRMESSEQEVFFARLHDIESNIGRLRESVLLTQDQSPCCEGPASNATTNFCRRA